MRIRNIELDEIKQVSKELEDNLEGFPDVSKEPMLQKVKDTKNQPEDEEVAALDSEIDDLEPEAEKDLELEKDLEAEEDLELEPEELKPEPVWDQPESRSQEAVLLRRADERQEARKRKRENFANGILRPGDSYLAAFLVPVVIMVICTKRDFPIWRRELYEDGYVSPICAIFCRVPS